VTVRIALLAGAALAGAALAPAPARAQSSYEQLQLYSGVLSHVRTNYVDSVEIGPLVRASIEGMLRSLDPHSHYVSRRDFELRSAWDRGELAGVGLSLEEADGRTVVLAVQAGGPAARAGVAAGDRLVRLDDSTVAGVSARALELRLLGEKGTRIRLTFERGAGLGADTFGLTLKRALIPRRVVSAPRLAAPGVGYVRLAEFTPLAPKELHDALKRLKGMGARHLVLDLRGNPGGSMTAMVEVAAQFLPVGAEVFHTRGRKRTGIDSVVTREAGDFAALPLVVLVDGSSASAAEVLAGALQDHDRALVVGRRSFGKALMQTSLPLPGGDVVWLTTARIATPSGRIIQRSYRGLAAEQYYALGGRGGTAPDTATIYRTARHRPVRGGGGVVPDVERPAPELPAWFSVAVDTGLLTAVADSVARTLAAGPAGLAEWIGAPSRWDTLLVVPFLARVQSRLGAGAAGLGAESRARLARNLAARAALVHWGEEAEEEFIVRNDPDVRLALEQFPKLAELLGPPPPAGTK
jgi:carboxyl-terminal processing protease